MNPIDESQSPTAGRPGDVQEEPEEKVGYRRPPRRHRFKKGTSGNPKGRRKGVKNEATMLREVLYRTISIQENGKRTKLPVMHAMLLRFADAALRGDTKAAAFLLNRYGAAGSPNDDLAEADLTIHSGLSEKEAAARYAERLRRMKMERGLK